MVNCCCNWSSEGYEAQCLRYAGTVLSCMCTMLLGLALVLCMYYCAYRDCNNKCLGDTAQRCGGSWRLSVYGPVPTDHATPNYQNSRQGPVAGAIVQCEPWCRVGWLKAMGGAAARVSMRLCPEEYCERQNNPELLFRPLPGCR